MKYGHLEYNEEDASPEDVERWKYWDTLQRAQLNKLKKGEKHSMTQERLTLLNSIRFFEHISERRFWLQLKRLQDFRLRHGTCEVSTDVSIYPDEKDQQTAIWAKKIRKEYKKFKRDRSSSILNEEKVQQLNHLGLNFLSNGAGDDDDSTSNINNNKSAAAKKSSSKSSKLKSKEARQKAEAALEEKRKAETAKYGATLQILDGRPTWILPESKDQYLPLGGGDDGGGENGGDAGKRKAVSSAPAANKKKPAKKTNTKK
jgi:hypothetical protein